MLANNLEAKAWVLTDGLSLARDLGITHLLIELDVKVLLELVWGTTEVNLLIDPIVDDCRKICQDFQRIQAHHTYQEVNAVADFLANHTRKEEDTSLQLLIFYHPFAVIHDLLYHDLLSIYKPRIVNLVTLHK